MCFDPHTPRWRSLIPEKTQFTGQNHNESTDQDENNDRFSAQPYSISTVAMNLGSWLGRSRPRYLLLILVIPFLLPLFCAACPLICAVEVCFRIRRRRLKVAVGDGRDGRRRSLDERGEEVGLLKRYLDDQLLLVVGSVPQLGDACGDDEGRC